MKSLLRLIVLVGTLVTTSWALAAEPQTPAQPAEAPAADAEQAADDAEKSAAEPAAADEQADKDAAEKGTAAKGSPQRFIPSEQVRADFDVSFPIDI